MCVFKCQMLYAISEKRKKKKIKSALSCDMRHTHTQHHHRTLQLMQHQHQSAKSSANENKSILIRISTRLFRFSLLFFHFHGSGCPLNVSIFGSFVWMSLVHGRGFDFGSVYHVRQAKNICVFYVFTQYVRLSYLSRNRVSCVCVLWVGVA